MVNYLTHGLIMGFIYLSTGSPRDHPEQHSDPSQHYGHKVPITMIYPHRLYTRSSTQ